MELVARLLGTELFEGFCKEDLEPLEPGLRARTYQKGAYLWHGGDPVTMAVVIVSGLVKARLLEADGNEAVVQLVLPGETVGEFPIFEEGARRYYDCIAVEQTETIVIPRDHLIFLLERDPKLTIKLAAVMMRRVLRGYDHLAETQFADLETRLARRLLALAKAKGEPDRSGTRIGTRLSQSLIASTVRASRENVNRALGRMADEGLIQIADGYIVIRDEEGLLERTKR
jgi:CRP/FNR family cyclic AMP-dependent transcriptional regulator